MILVIDNYDSFTYNLVQLIGRVSGTNDVEVHRNDRIDLAEIRRRRPTHLVLSPGPCTPNEAGISMSCVTDLSEELPILGVCLGHQSMGQATGARIVRAQQLMHGKTDAIHHDGSGLFQGLPSPITATRYHSLVIDPPTLSADFRVNAWSEYESGEREIMSIQHRLLPLFGLQFHPESFLTGSGETIIRNFLQQSFR